MLFENLSVYVYGWTDVWSMGSDQKSRKQSQNWLDYVATMSEKFSDLQTFLKNLIWYRRQCFCNYYHENLESHKKLASPRWFCHLVWQCLLLHTDWSPMLRMFENRILRKIFQPKTGEVMWPDDIAHLGASWFAPKINVVQVIKSRRMKLLGHRAHMGERRCVCKVLVGKDATWKT